MIELNWTIFIQMVNFLILMFFLNIILYKPILRMLEERESKIAEGQQKIKSLADEGVKLIDSYHEKLQQAKIEALSTKTNARKEATDIGNQIIDEAHQKAEQEIVQVRAKITTEINQAKKEIEPEMAAMADTIAEQILGRKPV